MDQTQVQRSIALKDKLEQEISRYNSPRERFDTLVRVAKRHQENTIGDDQRDFAVMLFLIAGQRNHPDTPPTYLADYLESLGF
ncbi:MAG: hypothetical protein PVH17_09135, partial [Anaerolineae bacterium]